MRDPLFTKGRYVGLVGGHFVLVQPFDSGKLGGILAAPGCTVTGEKKRPLKGYDFTRSAGFEGRCNANAFPAPNCAKFQRGLPNGTLCVTPVGNQIADVP